MSKINVHLILIAFLIGIAASCKKKDETTDQPIPNNPGLTVSSLNVKTSEFVSLYANYQLSGSYTGTFGSETIQLIKTSDSTLSFLVPNTIQGAHVLSFELGEWTFDVTTTEINTADEVLENIFTDFNTALPILESDTLITAQDIAPGIQLNNELQQLYNSLTQQEKIEVALLYEANKEIFEVFKTYITESIDAGVVMKNQSNCPKTDYKTFYVCTAGNLAGATSHLITSTKKCLEWLAYAAAVGVTGSQAWFAGPAAWGTTAVGAALTMGTAGYFFFTEVYPALTKFRVNVRAFLYVNWILVPATYLYLTEDYPSEESTNANLNGNFRSIQANESGLKSSASAFVNLYVYLSSLWSDFNSYFGAMPIFVNTQEPTTFNTNEVNITNISNANVQLMSINGESFTFKSLSGEEESFSFYISVNKEGFTHSEIKNARVLAESGFELSLMSSPDSVLYTGYNTGEIHVSIVSGGSPPFLFSLNDTLNYQSNSTFSDLSNGTYTVFVKDSDNVKENASTSVELVE